MYEKYLNFMPKEEPGSGFEDSTPKTDPDPKIPPVRILIQNTAAMVALFIRGECTGTFSSLV